MTSRVKFLVHFMTANDGSKLEEFKNAQEAAAFLDKSFLPHETVELLKKEVSGKEIKLKTGPVSQVLKALKDYDT